MKKESLNTVYNAEGCNFENETSKYMTLCQIFPDLFDIKYQFNKVSCDISEFSFMPDILAKIIATIKKRYPKVAKTSIANTLILCLLQAITARRIKYIEANNSDTAYPNYYAINFMPSGTGKDRILKDLNKYVNCHFKTDFKFRVENYLTERKIKIEYEAKRKYPEDSQERQRESYIKEKLKIRKPMLEISDGTREGLYSDAKALKEIGFGSLTLMTSELGHFLNSPTNEQVQYLKQINTAYDGKISSKSIKTEAREEDIIGVPVNILFHSDPTLFEKDLKNIFNNLLETGLGRRAIITFMHKIESCEMQKDPTKALEEQKQYFRDLAMLGYELFERISQIKFGTVFKMTDETFKTSLYPYSLKLNTLADREEKPLLKKEIISRELKAINIACGYAGINHPTEPFIYPEDMNMAINTVEKLSKDFQKFISYHPTYEDKYDRTFQFFLENLDKKYKKNDLTTIHYKKFGFSRKSFRENFDECIKIISEIAETKGYKLLSRPINQNSGNEYWLTTTKSEDLNDGVNELENLI